MTTLSEEDTLNEEDTLDPLDKLVAALDWSGCARKVNIANPDEVEHIADLFNRTTQLVQRYRNASLAKKREAFVASLLAALENVGLRDRAQEIQDRLAEGRRFEACFQELLSTLPKTAPGRLPADRHAWAVIVRMGRQVRHVEDDLQRHIQNQIREKGRIFDPASMLVEGDGGGLYRPDSVLGKLAAVTASSITMLAINNGWIDSENRVVVPVRVDTSEEDVHAVGITEYLGNAWSNIEYSEEQWRFFDGSVSDGEISSVDLDGNKRTLKSVVFKPNFTHLEIMDHIASERLDRYVLDNLADLAFMANVDKRVPPDGQAVAPAPQQYVSKEEAFSAIGLCNILHFNVLEDSNSYGGLRFAEWIRGYAWLQKRALRASEKLIDEVSESAALQELQQVGMSSEASALFVRLVTLSRGQSDLFDTPLIRVQGGSFVYHTGIIKTINLPRVVLSRLSLLQVSISPKGTAFEEATLKLLNDAKLSAKSFSFSRDDKTYQYDAAFVWNDVLFVFECKTYSLPLRRPMALFWFGQKMGKAVKQVQRLASGAEKYPDAIRSHLGANVTWKAIVPCVINSLPWSLGKLKSGTYIIDYSSVGRFLQSQTLFIKVPVQIEDTKILVRHHVKEQWPNTGPTAKHFLDEMDVPWQLKSVGTGFRAVVGQTALSDSLAFEGAYLQKTEHDMKRYLDAAGVPDPTNDLDVINEQLAKVRKKVQQASVKRKAKAPKKKTRGGRRKGK